MAVGKYSPTVSNAYMRNRDWWVAAPGIWFDKDGFDSYGYNAEGKDRAGYTEDEYLLTADYDGAEPYYYLYENVATEYATFVG